MPRSFAKVLGLSLLLLPWAGCVSSELPPGALAERSGAARPVVVALIDTGINPYHDAFRAPPGRPIESWLPPGVEAEVVNLTFGGDYDSAVRADEALWNSIQPGRLYAFAGTRVLGITLSNDPDEYRLRDAPEGTRHGTATASLVARENPDALIVAIQIDDTLCDGGRVQDNCPIFPPFAPAMEWASHQPWIDIISTSFGMPGNPPSHPDPGMTEYLAASRRVHEQGKILVAAAGNTVAPALAGYEAGPPWAIAVGGAEAAPRGEAPMAAKAVDVVANYTEWVASGDSVSGYEWNGGTSFATPLIAGMLSRALQEVRLQTDHAGGITPEGALAVGPAGAIRSSAFRAALNATAVQFAPTEWDPTRPPSNDTLTNLFTHSLPVLVPTLQQGWGYLHGGLASEIARRVLDGDLSLPAEKATTARHQAQMQALREAYWSQFV